MGQNFDQKDIRVIGYNKGGTFFLLSHLFSYTKFYIRY